MVERGRTELDKPTDRSTGLVSAFQSVTDGVLDLAKTHLELARAEARQELKVYGRHTARAAVGVGFALVGFGILNLAVICVAGAIGGLIAMAITAGVLGTIYTAVGVSTTRSAMRELKHKDALQSSKDELKRSHEWVKEITDSS